MQLHASYTADMLASICGGVLSGNGHLGFRYLTTDSRRPGFPEDTLFIGLAGAGRDGAAFATGYAARGGRVFLLHAMPTDMALFRQAAIVVVEDTLQALQQLAAYHRTRFQIPIVGITGSNGKTIVKEWLHQSIEQVCHVVRSPRSYNSQIGVPLSLWLLEPSHEIGIFEAGISAPAGMQRLAQMIAPTLGILTNIGAAHDEAFESRAQKLQEKLLLFTHCQEVLARHCDTLLAPWPSDVLEKTKTWGIEQSAHFRIEPTTQENRSGSWKVFEGQDEPYLLSLPFSDAASIENAFTTAFTLRLLGYQPSQIQLWIDQWQPIAMRMTMTRGNHGCTIINDSYSNDIYALELAINYWRQQAHGRRTIILSDMAHQDATASENIASLLRMQDLDRLVLIGPNWEVQANEVTQLAREVLFFPTTEAVLTALPSIPFRDETILVKGARKFGFERLAAALAYNRHHTQLEIDLNVLRNNLNQYKTMLKPGVGIMVMVKAFGYGSGDAEVARLLENSGVQYLAVAYPHEGIALRQAGIGLPIMVLNTDTDAFASLETWNLEPEVYSFDVLKALLHYLDAQGASNYPVHIKVDTGMHRLGFLPGEIPALCQMLASTDLIRVKSVFSHLSASEDAAADAHTHTQASLFLQAVDQIRAVAGGGFFCHLANSHAIERFPEYHFDMVRLGIGLYGGSRSSALAMRLSTTLAQVKVVEAGGYIGYGTHTQVQQETRIGVIRIGYADGLPRSLGRGRWQVVIRGKQVPTIGAVCMDMTMIDLSTVPDVAVNDEVEIFGPSASLHEMAAAAGTITYELMTGISQRVARVYTHE